MAIMGLPACLCTSPPVRPSVRLSLSLHTPQEVCVRARAGVCAALCRFFSTEISVSWPRGCCDLRAHGLIGLH